MSTSRATVLLAQRAQQTLIYQPIRNGHDVFQWQSRPLVVAIGFEVGDRRGRVCKRWPMDLAVSLTESPAAAISQISGSELRPEGPTAYSTFSAAYCTRAQWWVRPVKFCRGRHSVMKC